VRGRCPRHLSGVSSARGAPDLRSTLAISSAVSRR
jgi:hypothetical protein